MENAILKEISLRPFTQIVTKNIMFSRKPFDIFNNFFIKFNLIHHKPFNWSRKGSWYSYFWPPPPWLWIFVCSYLTSWLTFLFVFVLSSESPVTIFRLFFCSSAIYCFNTSSILSALVSTTSFWLINYWVILSLMIASSIF